jgi:hypothetical protein
MSNILLAAGLHHFWARQLHGNVLKISSTQAGCRGASVTSPVKRGFPSFLAIRCSEFRSAYKLIAVNQFSNALSASHGGLTFKFEGLLFGAHARSLLRVATAFAVNIWAT